MRCDMDRIEIGKKIKMLRERKGWSQRQLATESGQSPSYLPELERGEKCPTVEVLDNICFALGISLAEFFSEPVEIKKRDKLAELSPEQKQLFNDFLNSLD